MLDQVGPGDSRIGSVLLEFIKIHDYQLDRLDAVLLDGAHVCGIGADGEDAAGNVGVDGLDAPVEHLGKTCDLGDIAHWQLMFAQEFCGASGRDQFDVECMEPAGEVDQASLVRDAEQSAFYAGHSTHSDKRLWDWKSQ